MDLANVRAFTGVVSSVATALMVLTACSLTPAEPPGILEADAPVSTAAQAPDAAALKAMSCPEGAVFIEPETISLAVRPVSVTREDAPDGAPVVSGAGLEMNGVSLVSAYELTSDDPRFGGLSGLDFLPSGDLLTVSDQGDFVWLDLDKDAALEPVAASIAQMRGSDGQPLGGKLDADAEGLGIDRGLAFVSFERRHRVEAFDLMACGSGARATFVQAVNVSAPGLPKVHANGGAEALATADDGLIIGLETLDKGEAPVSLVGGAFAKRLPAQGGRQLTGMDYLSVSPTLGELYAVHRGFDPLRGARIAVTRTFVSRDEAGGYDMGDTQMLISLSRPALADNFEGIAVRRNAQDSLQLFLISDDNFSPLQQTLLYVFDVEAKTP